jgi:hypothetical protein
MDFKSELRDLKFKVLDGEIIFRVNSYSINRFKKELDFILANFKDDVITGSLALNLYGLIDRPIGDIDILINDKDRYQNYITDGYDEVISNRLGYKEFRWRKNIFSKKQFYSVDFFNDKGDSYQVFEYKGNLLKLHNPFDIISQKLTMAGNKHRYDLHKLFSDILP